MKEELIVNAVRNTIKDYDLSYAILTAIQKDDEKYDKDSKYIKNGKHTKRKKESIFGEIFDMFGSMSSSVGGTKN